MKLECISRSMLALLVATSFVAAQAEPKKSQEPQAKEAAAKMEPLHLGFSVTGLTPDNLAKVQESLKALSHKSYDCDGCNVHQATPGKCPACKMDLASGTHPLFREVTPSAVDSSVKLTLEPLVPVRLTELERTLEKNSVKIDATKFPIAGPAQLVFRGMTADQVPTIEKALADAKLFDQVKATFDSTAKEIQVTVQAGAAPPTRAKVNSSLEAAGVKTPLADVVWGQVMKKPYG